MQAGLRIGDGRSDGPPSAMLMPGERTHNGANHPIGHRQALEGDRQLTFKLIGVRCFIRASG